MNILRFHPKVETRESDDVPPGWLDTEAWLEESRALMDAAIERARRDA